MISNEELRNYIENENHLPNMPTTNEVAKNGINTSEIIMKLLQNQEELTLRLLELDKENEKLQNENTELKNRMNEIEKNQK